MLNERERRELQEIEQSIIGADPGFAVLFARQRARRRWSTSTAVPGALVVVLCVVATGLAVLGLFAHAAVVLAVALWPFLLLRARRGARRHVGGR